MPAWQKKIVAEARGQRQSRRGRRGDAAGMRSASSRAELVDSRSPIPAQAAHRRRRRSASVASPPLAMNQSGPMPTGSARKASSISSWLPRRQTTCGSALLKPRQPLDHGGRIRPAVDIVADMDDAMVGDRPRGEIGGDLPRAPRRAGRRSRARRRSRRGASRPASRASPSRIACRPPRSPLAPC